MKVLKRLAVQTEANCVQSRLEIGVGEISCTTLRVVFPATRSVAQQSVSRKAAQASPFKTRAYGPCCLITNPNSYSGQSTSRWGDTLRRISGAHELVFRQRSLFAEQTRIGTGPTTNEGKLLSVEQLRLQIGLELRMGLA